MSAEKKTQNSFGCRHEIEIPIGNEIFTEMEKRVVVAMSLVRKVNVFGNDENDEFSVVRENGGKEGIFKTWAVPVIPFIDSGCESVLAEKLRNSKGSFWETIGPELNEVIDNWCLGLKDKPNRLEQVLEKWRSTTQVYDRRLYEVFRARELGHTKEERVAELYLRLRVAFGFAAPFYHLEAIVGDGSDSKGNPVGGSGRKIMEIEDGGSLEMVGMLLPSALSRQVVATKLNWNGLDWEMIKQLKIANISSKDINVALRIAREIEVDIEDVIFAANVLQWIPVSVGGKKSDLETEEAQKLLTTLLTHKEAKSNLTVARNMNALIRFLNWFPLVKEGANFSEGKGWRYSAVCDTANALLNEINQGGVFEADFDRTFKEKLASQIERTDATSAKGRFILSLFGGGRLGSEFKNAIEKQAGDFISDIALSLLKKEEEEAVVPFSQTYPRVFVGGKTVGLREAAMIFGEGRVVGGKVITSEAIGNWLKGNKELWEMIILLDREKDDGQRVLLGLRIQEWILNSHFPDEIISMLGIEEDGFYAVRSSSFDEDTNTNGTAAGIYDSSVNVSGGGISTAIVNGIASFFSEKAINYRLYHELSDMPLFAINVSPYIDGRGGAAFSKGNGLGWEIVVGESPSKVCNADGSNFDSYKMADGVLHSTVNVGWVKEDLVGRVGQLLLHAEQVLGGKVDMEFVVNREGEVFILQLRSLHDRISLPVNENGIQPVDVKIDTLTDLRNLVVGKNEKLRINLGGGVNIDQFQGDLFRFLVRNRNTIKEVVLPKRIPRTSHFANICINLGIKLSFDVNE